MMPGPPGPPQGGPMGAMPPQGPPLGPPPPGHGYSPMPPPQGPPSQNMTPPTAMRPGPPSQVPPQQGPSGSAGPPPQGQSDLQKLQNSINQMEERGMQNDPRYSQARQLHQSMLNRHPGPPGPPPGVAAPPGPYPSPPGSTPTTGQGSTPTDRTNFQNTQMLQLRAQIMAYRILARNQPLPPQIAMAVQGKRPEQGGPPGSNQSSYNRPGSMPPGGVGPPNTQAPPSQPIPAMGAPRPGQPMGASGPISTGQPGAPTSGTGATAGPPGVKPNRITPIAKPVGVDPVTLLQERENRLAARVSHRIDELSNLPVNMADDIRRKAEIELRALRLLNFQRQLRAEVVACTRRDTTLETAINVKAYKRTKRQTLREARATEKLEKQQRLETERKKRQKHQEYLNAVLAHGRDMKEFHRNNNEKAKKLNRAVLIWHANAEREQKKEQERIEKERLRRLMAEDEEGYRKLIDQKKDKRLAFLLSQTDEYINQLTDMDKQQKKETRRKEREMQKAQRQEENLLLDESSQMSDVRIHVKELSTGKILRGEDAPLAS